MYHKKSKGVAVSIAAYSLIALTLAAYFTFAAIQGDYGHFKRIQIEAEEVQLKQRLAELQQAHSVIANKTRRLSDDYLDLDLLDEQARKVLGMARGDEIIIR